MSIDSHTSSESGKSGLSSFTSTSTTSSSFSSCGGYGTPPPTMNLLSARQKAQLRRSTTKLAKILGEAPICVDIDGYANDEGFATGGIRKHDSSYGQKKLQPSLSITSSRSRSREGATGVTVRRARSAAAPGRAAVDPDLYPLSATLRPASCDVVRRRTCASPVSGAGVARVSSESRRSHSHRTRTRSKRKSRSMSSESTLLLDQNANNNLEYVYEDGKTATSFLIVSPTPNPRVHHTQIQTQTKTLENVARTRNGGTRTRSERDSMCDSLYEPTFAIPSATALRREKMARVQKLLGEDVPVELVFPGFVSSRCDEKDNMTSEDTPSPDGGSRGNTSPPRAHVDPDSDSRSEIDFVVLDIRADADGQPQVHEKSYAPPTKPESGLDTGSEPEVDTSISADENADADEVNVYVDVPPPIPPKFEVKRKAVPSLPPVLSSSQESRSESAEDRDRDGPPVPPKPSPAAAPVPVPMSEQEQRQRVFPPQNQMRRPAYRPSRPNIRLETIVEQSPRASVLSSTSSTSTASSSPRSGFDRFRDSVDSTSSLLTNTTSSSYRFTSSADSHTHAHAAKGKDHLGLETTEEMCPGALARARIRELREQHGRREFGVYVPFSQRQSSNSASSGILNARNCHVELASRGDRELVQGMVGLRV